MHEINQIPPERMTPEQRRREIASLLANGLIRLRSRGAFPATQTATESEFGLGFPGHQRVHINPVSKKKTEF